MKKHPAQTTLKALSLAGTLAAASTLGRQIAAGDIHPVTLTCTIIAAVTAGLLLADDLRSALHAAHRRLRPTASRRFRTNHGDPAGWDDDEYEAYFAITADQPKPARRNIHPAA